MFGHDRFTVTPRRGELHRLRQAGRARWSPTIVLPVPDVARQGRPGQPHDLRQRDARPDRRGPRRPLRHRARRSRASTSCWTRARRLMPSLLDEEVTATYAGLRAAIDADDYLIDARRRPALRPRRRHPLDRADGRRWPSPSTSTALLAEAGLDLTAPRRPPRAAADAQPRRGRSPRPYQDADRIAADPAYGRIVCFCERVTAGEIRDAFDSTDPAGRPRRAPAPHPRA